MINNYIAPASSPSLWQGGTSLLSCLDPLGGGFSCLCPLVAPSPKERGHSFGSPFGEAGEAENIIKLLFHLADVLSIILPVLLSIAFMTIIERKQLAAHQRRVGPNTVGYYGILQPFADALKLVLKETIIPSQSNKIVFYLAPVSTLVFSLLGWAVIPFGEGIVLSDLSLGILYTLALSSLGVYGVLLAGWSANSKYAFLGSLRSTAAMISYELILSSAILIIILLTGTLNYTSIIEIQQSVWFIIPLFPVFFFYFISILAETSRTPFDLQEAKY